ncbi:FAD-dependent monooxygenase [Microbacterium album]|uniref:Oxidoreductase n=1 Tax=Microbacterium album TaxID=2053191 RepID=A0A917ID43_9MICO|nr:NAD(P)/FAD-dependent oxidoreductase [Microbacterium album]GGH36524.1 oxidoreductase [Microbacterium album]
MDAPLRDAASAADVAVVGGGPVGLLLACLLAQRDVRVVVLERRERPGRSTRAIGIHPPGLAALEAAGVGGAVRAEAARVTHGLARSGARELGRLAFREPVLTLPQHRTEAILAARLAELAPNAVLRGIAVTGLREAATGVRLAIDGPDGAGLLSAVYAVGADGVRSTVRTAMGAAWVPRPGRAEYVMADVPTSPEPAQAAVLRFEAGGVVESFPLPGGGRRWVLRRRGRWPIPAAAFAAALRERAGVVVPVEELSEPSAFVARQRLAVPFARGRVALAGDAAHEISPIGGQGMNLGLRDAVELAGALAVALDAGAPPDPFGRYAAQRARAAERAMRRAAFNMAMGAPATGTPLLLRNALARALTSPGARTALTRAFTMRGL